MGALPPPCLRLTPAAAVVTDLDVVASEGLLDDVDHAWTALTEAELLSEEAATATRTTCRSGCSTRTTMLRISGVRSLAEARRDERVVDGCTTSSRSCPASAAAVNDTQSSSVPWAMTARDAR